MKPATLEKVLTVAITILLVIAAALLLGHL
jgi:hypothetical protein